MSVVVDITADTAQAERRLLRIRRAFDRETFLKIVGQRMLAWVDENFRKAGAETPWKPLSPNTIAKRGGSAQPLRDTGRMAMSFTSHVEHDAVWVGTRDQKAPFHHYGTKATRITTRPGDRPARSNPRRPGALVFMTPAGPVFRRSVNHPGIPSRPLLPSRPLAEKLATGVLDAYVDRIANENG